MAFYGYGNGFPKPLNRMKKLKKTRRLQGRLERARAETIWTIFVALGVGVIILLQMTSATPSGAAKTDPFERPTLLRTPAAERVAAPTPSR